MERIWSPWRHAYVTRGKEADGCVFCAAASSDEGRALVVHAGVLTYVILNLYPYNVGHLMVLAEAFNPQGINIGMNLGRPAGAGIVDHLHTHLVPRWNGDTNFMTVVGEVRVLPEELPRTAEKLRPIFKRLAG